MGKKKPSPGSKGPAPSKQGRFGESKPPLGFSTLEKMSGEGKGPGGRTTSSLAITLTPSGVLEAASPFASCCTPSPCSPALHLPSTRPRPRGGSPFPGPSPVLRPDAQQVAPPVGPGSPGRVLRLLRPLDAARSPPVEASEGPAGRTHGGSRAAAAPAPAAAARPVSHRRHL